jgi:hypothetical protein
MKMVFIYVETHKVVPAALVRQKIWLARRYQPDLGSQIFRHRGQ